MKRGRPGGTRGRSAIKAAAAMVAEGLSTPPSNGGGTRWLRVVNDGLQPFSGVAILSADFRTRAIAPVMVCDPEGRVVPSRLVNEVRGPFEKDGKRRWAFDLEFFCDCSAGGEVAYPAVFEESEVSHASEEAWEARHQGGTLAAMELEWPHATRDDDRHCPAL